MTEIKLKKNMKLILKKIPTSNGVYFFFDKNKKPLYIGKAVNLRSRIKQHLERKTYSPFLDHLLNEAENIKFEITKSEIEALILESQYIKKFKPKYNQKLRDDKQYFYVGITKETFPRLFLTHQPQKQFFQYRHIDISFLGPFTDGAVLKSTLRFLRRVFPYCTCKQKHNNYCLNYHIGKCLGICCLKDERQKTRDKRQVYLKNIRAIKDILTGKRESLTKELKKELMKLAEKEEFKKAIELRDKIKKLERVFENAKILRYFDSSKYFDQSKYRERATREMRKIFKLPRAPKRIEGYDVSNIQGSNATGSMVVFTDGQPDKNEYRKFKIRTKKTPDDTAMLKEVLIRRFNHPEWQFPDLILIDGGKAQLNAADGVISPPTGDLPKGDNFKFLISLASRDLYDKKIPNPKFQIPIISLAKGKKEIFSTTLRKPIPLNKLPQNIQNLILQINAEAHRFAIGYYRRLHRKELTADGIVKMLS